MGLDRTIYMDDANGRIMKIQLDPSPEPKDIKLPKSQ